MLVFVIESALLFSSWVAQAYHVRHRPNDNPNLIWRRLLGVGVFAYTIRYTTLYSLPLSPLTSALNLQWYMTLVMFICRTVEWSLSDDVYTRVGQTSYRDPSVEPPTRRERLMDSFAIVISIRGIGWSWRIPHHRLQYSLPRTGPFAEAAIRKLLRLSVILVPTVALTTGTAFHEAGSVHRTWLEPVYRHTSKSVASSAVFEVALFAIQATSQWASMEAVITLCALADCCARPSLLLAGVEVAPFDSSAWPDMFCSPWRADSVARWWARWHGLFARPFEVTHRFVIARWPGEKDGKRTAALFATFLLSGFVLHDIPLYLATSYKPFDWDLGCTRFFLLQACAMLIETKFRQVTGRKVGGLFGRGWTASVLASGAFLMRRQFIDRLRV